MEFADSLDRWSGPGNREFRANVAKASAEQSDVRLVVVRTKESIRVQAGDDASKLEKEFFVRDDLVGRVIELRGDHYVVSFRKTVTK